MKVISLISGGLDSSLATKIILDQGIEVVGLNCVNPFSVCGHNSNCNCVVKRICKKLGIELRVINLSEEFLEILKNPSYGYGSNMNPCIDCRIMILKKAKGLMHEIGANFIVTGEVVGQRPMSQKRPTLRLIEKKAGVEDILVRPLSAKLLEPGKPERLGWVNRDKLFAISGRSRKEQINLAKQFNIDDYLTPAGGCLVTNEGYTRKVKDLIKHNKLSLENIALLKAGRHFRINPKTKLIVGRDEKENQKLLDMAREGDFIFEPLEEIRGPVALGRGEFLDEQIDLSCRIIGRYCDDKDRELRIRVRKYPCDKEHTISCLPFKDSELFSFRI